MLRRTPSSTAARTAQARLDGRPVIRLIVEPAPHRPGAFIARLDSGEVVVQRTRQPLADGARALLGRGFAPSTPLTMRHAGSRHDSFRPAPIRAWANWTFTEGEATALRRQRWSPREMPIAAVTEGQKSISATVGLGYPALPAAAALRRRVTGRRRP